MHPYATDSAERRLIPLYLAAASIAAAFLLHKTLQGVIPWWIDAPSVAGFYALFFVAFERWLWRIPFLHSSGLLLVPNLNGRWSGSVTTSFDGHATDHEAYLEIHQTWTGLSICLKTDRSQSRSLIGTITTQNPTAGTLSYEYINEPKANAVANMQIHRGTARLDLNTLGELRIFSHRLEQARRVRFLIDHLYQSFTRLANGPTIIFWTVPTLRHREFDGSPVPA